ncbi:MAG: hypothetical protein AB2404_10090, partial [Planifilum fimeticola]
MIKPAFKYLFLAGSLLVLVFLSVWDMGLNLGDIRDLPNTFEFLKELWPLDFSMVDHALDETLITL